MKDLIAINSYEDLLKYTIKDLQTYINDDNTTDEELEKMLHYLDILKNEIQKSNVVLEGDETLEHFLNRKAEDR